MMKLLNFLNTGFGLLLIGSLVGTVGLFTWQRRDWLAKQQHLRAQVMLDRRIGIIERVNADVGRLLAAATIPVVDIRKNAPAGQKNEGMTKYNDQQVEWFEAYSSYETLLAFYFSPSLSEAFVSRIVGGYEKIDVAVSAYQRDPNDEHYATAYDALQSLRRELRSWNSLALSDLRGN